MTMKGNQQLNDLLYLGEHLSCRNYMQHVERGFKYLYFDEETNMMEKSSKLNYLIFQLTGKSYVICNNSSKVITKKNEFILIPKNSKISAKTIHGSSIISLGFDLPYSNCDKLVLSDLAPLCKTIQYEYKTMKMRRPMNALLEFTSYCLKNGMNCVHLHTHIEELLFFIFRGYYTREELAQFFYPIISKDPDFKDKIISNLKNVKNINDMIGIMNMGRTQFYETFRENFGMTAKQYLIKITNEKIKEKASEPGITAKDLMYALNFDSESNFFHYTKQQFGCTPKELISKLSNNNTTK